MKTLSPEERLIKSRIKLLNFYPFFGNLLISLRLRESRELETAAVDGVRLWFNPDFITRLSDRQINYLMVHEIGHLIFDHLERGNGLNHKIFNYAADYVINLMLEELIERFPEDFERIPGGLLDPAYRDMISETVYDILWTRVQDFIKKLKSGEGDTSTSTGIDDLLVEEALKELFGELLDDHSFWDRVKSDKDPENGEGYDRDTWKSRIIRSAPLANGGKMAGTMPGGIARLLNKLINPTKNWREILAEYTSFESNDFTYSRPNVHYLHTNNILPSFREPVDTLYEVYIGVDCSGSISELNLAEMMSELMSLLAHYGERVTGKLWFFDAAVHAEHDLREGLSGAIPHGNGGTSFKCIFDHIEREGLNPRVLLMLTDGEPSEPNWGYEGEPPYPVLWVLTKQGNHRAPFGTVTILEN